MILILELRQKMNKNFCRYLLSVDTKTTNRVIIYLLGIRIRFLKPGIKTKCQKNALSFNCPIEEIPKATGNLRKIQLANLKIAKIFRNLCHENNLRYWLDHGSLLGAIRHHGFVPWDDDVDMSMLREDYEKFIDLFLDKIPNHDELYLDFCNNGKDKCFIKLKHKYLANIGIDIFPYDFYYKPLTEEEKATKTKELKDYLNKNKLIYRIMQPIYIHSYKLMKKRFNKIYQKQILKNNPIDINMKPALVYGLDYPHLMRTKMPFHDYETILPLKTISFEDEEFGCPNNPDTILKQIYGDYMQLPKDCYARHTNPNGFNGEELDKFINQEL